jgi:hypothetical protein
MTPDMSRTARRSRPRRPRPSARRSSGSSRPRAPPRQPIPVGASINTAQCWPGSPGSPRRISDWPGCWSRPRTGTPPTATMSPPATLTACRCGARPTSRTSTARSPGGAARCSSTARRSSTPSARTACSMTSFSTTRCTPRSGATSPWPRPSSTSFALAPSWAGRRAAPIRRSTRSSAHRTSA